MTVATPAAPAAPSRTGRRAPRSVKAGLSLSALAPAVAREQTLDQMLGNAWAHLTSNATIACLFCGGAMRPRFGAGSGPVGGRCEDCSTTIG